MTDDFRRQSNGWAAIMPDAMFEAVNKACLEEHIEAVFDGVPPHVARRRALVAALNALPIDALLDVIDYGHTDSEFGKTTAWGRT